MLKSICLFFMTLFINPSMSLAKNILVVSALPEERKVLEGLIKNSHPAGPPELMARAGKYKDISVALSLVGIGKVLSAMNTQRLIHQFGPSAIIFTGVAGAINPEYKIGDIIIGIRTFQHDYGFLEDQGLVVRAVGTMPEVGVGTGQESIYQTLDINPLDLKVDQKNNALNFKAVQTNNRVVNPRLLFGTIATGDQFVASKKRIQELKELGADAVEMEGASVCFVASQNHIPCYIIRTITDSADGDAPEDFANFLSIVIENNVNILRYILDKLSLPR